MEQVHIVEGFLSFSTTASSRERPPGIEILAPEEHGNVMASA